MRKTALLVVCVLILCGGLCHLYLVAQVKVAESEAQNNAQSVLHPEYTITKPITAQANQRRAWDNAKAMEAEMLRTKELDCARAIKSLPGIADAKVILHQRPEWERNAWTRTQTSVGVFIEAYDNRPIDVDVLRIIGKIVAPFFGSTADISIVDAKVSRTYDGAGVETTGGRPQTAADLAGPDIGKFRLPITYLLHNIPAESLIDFLAEEFPQVETEVVDNGFPRPEWILITASLTDHRMIMKMLTEIRREIESISNNAAEGEEMEMQTIVVFPIKFISASDFLTQHRSTLNPLGLLRIAVDDCTDSLVVAGTTKQLAVVEELVLELNQPALDTIYDFDHRQW